MSSLWNRLQPGLSDKSVQVENSCSLRPKTEAQKLTAVRVTNDECIFWCGNRAAILWQHYMRIRILVCRGSGKYFMLSYFSYFVAPQSNDTQDKMAGTNHADAVSGT